MLNLKEIINNSIDTLIGAVITTPSPEVAEIFSKVGFDWFWLDMEHGTLNISDIGNILRITPNVPSVVRIPKIDPAIVKRVLDCGPAGIMAPGVNTREEVELLVELSKYYPEGNRAVGAGRANFYGFELMEYLKTANDNLMIFVQIETVEGYNNLDSILKVKGLDGIQIGPFDLSTSMGKPGQISDPEVQAAIKNITKKTRAAGLAISTFDSSEKKASEYKALGFDLAGTCVDMLTLVQAAKTTIKNIKK
jgi:2-keto-3-deoxy-L-rhamnonate aldolase RhmA